MQSSFSRMTPDLDNMVTQQNSPRDIQLLCVECGWQGSVVNPAAAEPTFKVHPCRLTTASVSTHD